jgi:hypothetical protein
MATTSTKVQELYTDIVADLQVYYSDAVLIDNSQFLLNRFDISGESGATVRVPVTNSYTDAAVVSPGQPIIATTSDFDPISVDIAVSKYGVGSDVHAEALEDGGIAVVRQALLERLSGGLSQAVDVAGFTEAAAAGGNSSINQDGNATLSGSGNHVNLVMDRSALGMAIKRQPSTTVWYDNDADTNQFRSSIRVGFKAIPNGAAATFGIRKLNDVTAIGSGQLSLDDFAKSVANLRAGNFPGMNGLGMYAAFVAPSTEFAVASQLNSVTQSTIGDLSEIGNRALLTGLIGQAASCEFFRSNNLPQPV